MGSVEVRGVSLKTWVWSELGLEKGGRPEGKVWRVKQASKRGDGRGESGSTASWGCWGEGRAGRSGEQPRGASGARGLLKVARRAQSGDPGMWPHLTQGQGGTASRFLATVIQNWLVMSPLPWAVARFWPR